MLSIADKDEYACDDFNVVYNSNNNNEDATSYYDATGGSSSELTPPSTNSNSTVFDMISYGVFDDEEFMDTLQDEYEEGLFFLLQGC